MKVMQMFKPVKFEIETTYEKSSFMGNPKACESGFFHIASSLISLSSFFEEVRCLILASSQMKLRGYIEFLKFDVTINK